jgi:hypothetical protein
MEKRYRSALLLGVLLICLFWGCSFNNNTVKNANGNSEEVLPTPETEDRWENTPLMTREYLLEHGFATEEDLEQIDIERMIADGKWYEGIEETINIPVMIRSLKNLYLLDEYVIDYSYLVETDKSEEPFTEEDIKQIKVVAYVYNSGTTNASMVFDFSERKAYVDGGGHLLERIPCPEDYIELSDEQIAEVKKLMQDCKVPEWKRKYKGHYDSADSDWGWWYLCYELEDGRIYSNSGGGICYNLPEKIMDLRYDLKDFFRQYKVAN